MTEMTQGFKTGAMFSPDRVYRYCLWRTWGTGPHALFIGLNPSTADEKENDPTIVREIGFAKAWGLGGLYKLNIFGHRSTDPKRLKGVPDPIGPDNDRWLRTFIDMSTVEDSHIGKVVAAWGTHGSLNGRGDVVTKMLAEPGITAWCFGTTKDGHPRHPLYLSKTTELTRYPG